MEHRAPDLEDIDIDIMSIWSAVTIWNIRPYHIGLVHPECIIMAHRIIDDNFLRCPALLRTPKSGKPAGHGPSMV